ncbi:MAG: hypothetical protein Q9220_005048 [cf. Caloplaca sp. 1 TL-2023]
MVSLIAVVEDHPIGYPRQAAYADSDECFMIYRRFGYIHARLLLHRQDEIRELEEELHDKDLRDGRKPDRQDLLKSRDQDQEDSKTSGPNSRIALLDKIEDKTLKYGSYPCLFAPAAHSNPLTHHPGQLLLQAQSLVAMNKPPTRDQTSLRNFLQNHPGLVEAESKFAYHKEDLITLRPGRDHSMIDAAVENMLKTLNCKALQTIFRSEETARKTVDPNINYYTRSRINAFVTLIITFIIVTLLVVPIWLLYHFSVTWDSNKSNLVCIGVLLVSTLIFSAVLSLFTKARRHEVLAASAG